MNITNVAIPENLLSENTSRNAYFMRINSYNNDVMQFLHQYFQMVVKNGAFLDNGFKPVTANDIEYFEAQGVGNFRLDKSYISDYVKTCLSSSDNIYASISESLFNSLTELKQQGKNDSILKNTFIKFLCWLRRDLARALNHFSNKTYPPKILCKGDISRHEFMLLSAAVKAGCDVLIVEYAGSDYYKKLDSDNKMTTLIEINNAAAFPADFSLSMLKKMPTAQSAQKSSSAVPAPAARSSNTSSGQNSASQTVSQQTIAAPRTESPVRHGSLNISLGRNNNSAPPSVPQSMSQTPIAAISADDSYDTRFCTNAWITGEIFDDIKTPVSSRGENTTTICNLYVRINGVENKSTYLSDLYKFYESIKDSIKPLVFDTPIEIPSNQEITAIQRGNYRTYTDLINDMTRNIIHSDPDTQAIIRHAFAYAISDYAIDHPEIRKIMTCAVYTLAWFKRYQHDLFGPRDNNTMGCVIMYNGCKNDTEITFIKMLSHCPVDILILCPDLEKPGILADDLLYERNFVDSYKSDTFPFDGSNIQMGTVAYYANKELDEIMYNDSGLYRNYQYTKATTVTLKTIYEEIPIIWAAGIQYREGFSTSSDKVTIPVIMAKISGVKDGNMARYWNEIHDLIEAAPTNTIVFKNQPLTPLREVPCDYVSAFFRNGKLDKDIIKSSNFYKYGFLKENVQDHILNTLDSMLQTQIIKNQNDNGYIYRIVHVALDINGYILRLIQGFDFTAVNPKLIYINTRETIISRNDSVLLAFLSKLGFDVIMYIPTGYQSAEKYLAADTVNCLETGGYVFDARIPDLRHKQIDKSKSLFSQIFSKK